MAAKQKRGFDKKRLMREIAKDLKQQDRAKLAALRQQIRDAQSRRRVAMARAKEQCRLGRVTVRERIKAYRAAERERINNEVAEMRATARAKCSARKQRIRKSGASVREKAKQKVRAEQALQREIARATARGKRTLQRSKREAHRESDDEVRQNLPAELVPVFEHVKRSIRGTPYKSRTEAFLQWGEEHPGEVIRIQGDEAEADVARLVAEQEKLERESRRPPQRRLRKAELDRLLEAVPF